MGKEFKILDWDSNFFDFPVAEIENNILNNCNYLKIFDELLAENIQLAYYSSKIPFVGRIDNLMYDIFPIIKRIPIIKQLNNASKINPKISLYTEEYPEEDLIKLAQLAGKQGRFGKDKNIPESKCDELFKLWIINSVNKKIADEVYVYRENDKIVGFSTLKVVDGIGYAPLFAVDRNYEGKGISFALMNAMENILIGKKCSIVLSDTQDMNKKALKIYERYGFKFNPPEYVYHLWKKKQ
jgi:hypothetical protein